MSAPWTPTPEAIVGRLDPVDVERRWSRLHAGDALDRPTDAALLEGWTDYHNGHFQRARDAGLRAGSAGWSLAQKATCVYAVYVEPHESTRLILLSDVAERALEHQALDRRQAAAWYWQGYALGRFSQGISVAKALAQGIGARVKAALEQTVTLQPAHADGHLALASFHAEVIDKVGELIGGMTYGARRTVGLDHYERAVSLVPDSPVFLYEQASGLLKLDGDGAQERSMRLLEAAGQREPADAMERLYVCLARADLDA
ncbi:hypothetical protein ACFQNJ_02870 [Hydrogenophaga bisanensis]|uniref:XRE family transcriptional regulator n=1 Tax=Hydrogenophaga bisanensis TaxID=439611 RepID=A0ABW2R4Q5_9BURK|nr:hypothetical protein [Hydrogenophaga sp.]